MKLKKNIISILFLIFIIILICVIGVIIYNKNVNINAYTNEKFTNDEIDDVYIINLDERKDRLDQITSDFKDSFRLYRTSAVKMDPPQQGCANSFLRIIQMAKEKGLLTVLIFEDDNKPVDGYQQRWKIIKNYLDTHMNEWEIFNGGQRHIMGINKMIELDNGVNLIKPIGGFGTNWIYINNNVYDKILNEWHKNKIPIDLYFSNQFNIWCCYPMLGLQYTGQSNIDGTFREFDSDDENILKIYDREVKSYKSKNKI